MYIRNEIVVLILLIELKSKRAYPERNVKLLPSVTKEFLRWYFIINLFDGKWKSVSTYFILLIIILFWYIILKTALFHYIPRASETCIRFSCINTRKIMYKRIIQKFDYCVAVFLIPSYDHLHKINKIIFVNYVNIFESCN